MTSPAPRALVAGLGLIGGSIGMALRARGWRVSYLDPHVEVEAARRAGAADERATEIGGADIVIVATPVDTALELLKKMPPMPSTSVCSVMTPLRAIADQRGLPFAAGHPMAGSHEHGLEAARPDLFRDRTWFLDRDDALVARLVRDCGAKADRVDAHDHDRAVALTSHLPQLLSTALGAVIDDHPEAARFAGSGLATFLRLAGSDAGVWSSVLTANHDNVAALLHELTPIVQKILEGDTAAFEKAQRALKKL